MGVPNLVHKNLTSSSKLKQDAGRQEFQHWLNRLSLFRQHFKRGERERESNFVRFPMEMLAVPAGRPQPRVQLIREDLVQRLSDPQQIGLVARVAGDLMESNTSNSEEDDEQEDRYIQEGCAQIVWLHSKESIENVTDVRVIDRAFLHGDVVAAVSNPLGQTGTVVDIELSVDVELPTNIEIVENIDSRRLRRVRESSHCFQIIQCVCLLQ